MTWSLVIGGTSKIGKAICLNLAQKGHHIAIQYKTQKQQAYAIAEACQKEGVNTSVFQADFSTEEGVEHFINTLQASSLSFNNLICNTGPYHIESGLNTSLSLWQYLYQTNVWCYLRLVQILRDQLIDNQGAIITLGVAGIGKNRANCYNTAYVCAKETLWSITRSMAKELAPSGVRINMVAPGHLESSEDLSRFLTQIPMKRPASCQEIASLVNFLLSSEAKYITGQIIEVSGGAFL